MIGWQVSVLNRTFFEGRDSPQQQPLKRNLFNLSQKTQPANKLWRHPVVSSEKMENFVANASRAFSFPKLKCLNWRDVSGINAISLHPSVRFSLKRWTYRRRKWKSGFKIVATNRSACKLKAPIRPPPRARSRITSWRSFWTTNGRPALLPEWERIIIRQWIQQRHLRHRARWLMKLNSGIRTQQVACSRHRHTHQHIPCRYSNNMAMRERRPRRTTPIPASIKSPIGEWAPAIALV